MSNLTDYFVRRDADLPQPQYNSGDRVFGHWNRIPFVGTVVREIAPLVMVHADLPIKHEDVVHNIITPQLKDIKLLKVYDER
jgi:hypothetical protein